MRGSRRGVVGWGVMLVFAGVGLGCRSPQSGSAVTQPGSGSRGSAAGRSGSAPRPSRAKPEKGAQPGEFDFYLLTLSWSPEYCLGHPADAQCAAAPGFVLHGLWPENTNGTYPESCSTAAGPSDPGAYKDIYPDQGLLLHEWRTHGTCSGLAPDRYFELERQAKAAVKIPANLSASAGKSTPAQETPGEILGAFAQANGEPVGDFVVSCGNNRLTAVQVCLDKNLKAMSCPAVKSCRANVVKIAAPGAVKD